MDIKIPNGRLLRFIGFYASGDPSDTGLSLSLRGWINVIKYRLTHLRSV